MTMLDSFNEICDATTLNTGGVGTYTIGNQIDLSVAGRDIGNGEPAWLIVQVATTATSGGSATATFTLVTASATDLTTGATTLATSPTWAVANMTATGTSGAGTVGRGTVLWRIALPSATYARYLGIRQTTGTQAFSTGAVDAFITTDPQVYAAYANAI